jgi:hypothetical protein
MKIKLPVQQQIMIESFTERLGNPVTAGAGNAKELRETKPFPIDKSLIDAALTWETALEIAEEYEASKQQENKKLSQPCIDDFTDLINTYLTTGELVPGDFIECFRRALVVELRMQKHTLESIQNTLALLENEPKS